MVRRVMRVDMTMCIWWYIPGHTEKIQGQLKLKKDRKQDSRVYILHCESESYGGALKKNSTALTFNLDIWNLLVLRWVQSLIFHRCLLDASIVQLGTWALVLRRMKWRNERLTLTTIWFICFIRVTTCICLSLGMSLSHLTISMDGATVE